MALVYTPRYYRNDTYTLASIIQGEAGGEGRTGMVAVASVIQNRANSNFSGFGTGLIDQALAPNQFQGQSRPPSADALAVADQLNSGNLQDITGGATSYANPGSSTASWARGLNTDNALQIGHHFFTDNQQGIPFANAGVYSGQDFASVANSYTPATSYTGISPNGFGLDPSVTAPDAAAFEGTTPQIYSSPTDATTMPTDITATAPSDVGAVDPGSSLDPASMIDPGSTQVYTPADTSYASIGTENKQTGQIFSSSQKNNYNYKKGSETIPEAIDRQSKTLAADTASADQAIQGAAKTVDQAAKLNAQTGKDIGDKIDSTVKNIFTRGVMVVTGVVFVAGGLWLFAHPDKLEAIAPKGLKPA